MLLERASVFYASSLFCKVHRILARFAGITLLLTLGFFLLARIQAR
ncbi:MAG: hypothetical protein ABIT36_07025 [Steroidobacteraceae bacterium]